MEPTKVTEDLTFDVKYADGTIKEVKTGILMEVEPDGKHISFHMGTNSSLHIFAFIDALKEAIDEFGLTDLYNAYLNEIQGE